MSLRWAITGAGLITGAGDAPQALFESLLDDPVPADGDDVSAATRRIRDFDVGRYIRRKGLKLLSRTSQLATAAAAGLQEGLEGVPGECVGVVFGTAWGSLDTVVRFEREAYTEGPRFVDPILFTETVANVPAGRVSIHFGWSALNATVSAGTSSGLQAVERAVQFLDEGRADVVVAGGGDELNEHLLRTLRAEGFLAAGGPSRPYHPASRGPVGAEGACLLTLESVEHAEGRGAHVWGQVAGAASATADPEKQRLAAGCAEMLRQLLARCGWAVDSVDLLVLSGNGNSVRDSAEVTAVGQVFGATAPPAVAPKAWLGESWGAGGGTGIVIALEAVRRSVVPGFPSDGGSPPDGLRFPAQTIDHPVRRAIVIDCAESGQLAAVALSAGG
jgi:3-oxoacyl-[acyl-carrier-protein] synthase II